MSIFESKTPVWPMDFDAPRIVEERDGLNPSICEHGELKAICGRCKPVKLKKKKDVQKVR